MRGVEKQLTILDDEAVVVEITVEQFEEYKKLKAELHRANCQIAGDEILQCDMRETIEELKAENEELNTINARLLGRLEIDKVDTSLVSNLDKELRQKEKEFYIAIQKVVKLKQTLTEIKEVVEKAQWDYRMPKEVWDLILQKINEVVNEQ